MLDLDYKPKPEDMVLELPSKEYEAFKKRFLKAIE